MKNKTFIEKAKEIHRDKYDYSLVNYINVRTKIKIICKEHGEFEQRPDSHLSGKGCPLCSKFNKLDTETFIERAKEVHGDKYDYSLVDYVGSKIKVKIICSEHGEFEQIPCDHLIGRGCRKCGVKSITKTNSDFIIKSRYIHGDKYNYSFVNYINSQESVIIVCPEHGEFEQIPNNHISKKQGCPKCSLTYNKSEEEIKDFIKSLNINIVENDRTILNGKELDIYIPENKLAIEYNGLYWHSNQFIDKNYHLNKTNKCVEENIQLIHIFEDEWVYKKDIVKSRLRNLLNLTENKIYTRKCEIREVSSKESGLFLENNHIQGKVGSKVKLGLYYNDELVSLMTFGGLRKNLGGKKSENHYELIRFCNKLNTNVIGGASKLLKHFIKTYNPKEIISYADRRWSNGNLYDRLGFELSHISKPNYFYINDDRRENRFKYRKDVLIKEGFNPNKSEREIMEERGFKRIYDCGTISYSLKF